MALTTAKRDNMEQRRARVAQLRLRGLSSREIALALAQGNPPILSPTTGRPYEHAVILSDLEALKLEWQASRGEATDKHIDRQFAEMQEIKRAGWAGKDPELALKALRDEMSLLGTKKAQELNINVHIMVTVDLLIKAIEKRGESASTWFEEMLQEMQLADSNGDSP